MIYSLYLEQIMLYFYIHFLLETVMSCTSMHPMSLFNNLPKWLISYLIIVSTCAISVASFAVTPSKSTLILGMDVQGQRLNLYQGCSEGSVSCDDLLLESQDLSGWAFRSHHDQQRLETPLTVKTYQGKTIHSVCSDGVSPCAFQGYGFEDAKISGFIDPATSTIILTNKSTGKEHHLSYQLSTLYLPLSAQSSLIDSIYANTDSEINDSYQSTRREVAQLYGHQSEAELKQDQIKWLVRRSNICGADTRHLPRTQAEKVCFIQQNMARMNEYFWWID